MSDKKSPRTGQTDTGRRRFLRAVGTGAVFVTGLSGCVGTENGGTDTPTTTETSGDSGGGGGGGDGGGGGGTTTTGATTATTAATVDEVLVGQPASLTGKWDFLQPAVSQATDLAVSEINDAGGPLGATFTVNRKDTAVKPQKAREVVRQFVNNQSVHAINGLFSSEITPLWDFLQKQKTPIVTPWPGTRFLDTRGGDKGTPKSIDDDQWAWRTVIGDTVHTAGAAQAMLDNDFSTMGIMNGSSAGETGWADAFQGAYENLGGTVAKRVEVPHGQSSYQSQLEKLFEADFDAWALALALEDATTVIKNWQQGGYGKKLLLEDGLMSGDLIKQVGEQAKGAWIAAGSTQGPNYSSFESKFKEAGDADIHAWGVAAYDATNVIALATHRAGEATREAIEKNVGPVAREGGTTVSTFAEGKKALDNGEEINYEGAVTNTDFTKHGNVWGNVAVSKVTPDGFKQQFAVKADRLKQKIENY